MAEGQVAQAFGGKVETMAEFKTETGLGVKVFVRPGAAFVRDIEKWLKDNDIHEFKHSITQFDGQIAAIITYRKKDAIRVEELLKDTAEVVLALADKVLEITKALAVDSRKSESNDSKPQD